MSDNTGKEIPVNLSNALGGGRIAPNVVRPPIQPRQDLGRGGGTLPIPKFISVSLLRPADML